MADAHRIRIDGTVQGVGFRPFVYRLARRHGIAGWVRNDEEGVCIHAQGASAALDAFLRDVRTDAPPAASIASVRTEATSLQPHETFAIRHSTDAGPATVRITPDLPVCNDCRRELFTPSDRRHRYPYINCTNCGPRYSIVRSLPYDRPRTTMADWPMCDACAAEYQDPLDRRFHAQPVACPDCGPTYVYRTDGTDQERGEAAIRQTARALREGQIVAIKGIGGYHLACDARNADAVQRLRERKVRAEKPFAVMTADHDTARGLVDLSDDAAALLTDPARPIVLAPSRAELPGVAPNLRDLGVMLPYTPMHLLLFDVGAPDVLVMTSANRSSEPIAYRDADALERLSGLADAFLVGERAIARRVDDSVARADPFGPVVLRRSRGYAPQAVATLPTERPVLALGADLKNTVTLVVNGQAFVSHHIGDLDTMAARTAFETTVEDVLAVYDLAPQDVTVAHDAHPEFATTRHALALNTSRQPVQHHRAHVASVLAEREAWTRRVVGVAFDGTGYGDDGTIWGGEVFVGSVAEGFKRVGHLRPSVLPGGDAAIRWPVQAAAGFLADLDPPADLTGPPFSLPDRFEQAQQLIDADVRLFPTTSAGRLFDAAAALLGFTGRVAYEGQAAIELEHQARGHPRVDPYPFPALDHRPLLTALLDDRAAGRSTSACARAFHEGVVQGLVDVLQRLGTEHAVDTVALSGGVFQNQLLLRGVHDRLADTDWTVWTNHHVPPGDGGISLGQAALAARRSDRP